MRNRLSVLERLVLRLALATYPNRFRRHFAEAIEETFRDRLLEARQQRRVVPWLARFLTDSLLSAVRERLAPVPPPRPPQRPPAFRRGAIEMVTYHLRHAARTLVRRPALATTAVATIALGVGSATAVFSVVRGVLLRPLPYPAAERLVRLTPVFGARTGNAMSFPDLADVAAGSSALTLLAGYSTAELPLTGLGDAEILNVARVTAGLITTLGASPALGRDLRPDESGAAPALTAVVSHRFWSTRLASSHAAIGSTIRVGGTSYEVVGVAPEDAMFPENTDVWIPAALNPSGCGRTCYVQQAIGQLAPGATLAQANAELAGIAGSLASLYPDSNADKGFAVTSLLDSVVASARPGLMVLMAAVLVVLLIMCSNVANLFLASALARESESAVRVALGAGRRQLLAQWVTEGLLLVISGSVAGLVTGWLGLAAFRELAGGIVPRSATVRIDPVALFIAVAVTVATTVLFSIIPALRGRRGLSAIIGGGGTRAGSDRWTVRARSIILVVEVALSTSLLIGAGLLLRTFASLHAVDLGYETENITRFRVVPPASEYRSIERVRAFYRTLESELAALPGVRAAVSAYSPPLSRRGGSGTVFKGGEPRPAPEDRMSAGLRPVGPGFFDAMGIGLISGRLLEPADDAGSEFVVVVNEAFASAFFPGEDPIGRSIQHSLSFGYDPDEYMTIVGVVRDVRGETITEPELPMIYPPHGRYGPSSVYVIVRTAPGVILEPAAVRSVVSGLDAGAALHEMETYRDVIRRRIAPTTMYLGVVAAFAGAALLLAAVGLYGVISYVVSSRTREIGIRMALGARRGRIALLVAADAMVPVLAGLAGGLLLARASGRVLSALLFEIDAGDPAATLASVLVLTLVALAAIWAPARRALRLEPSSVLRAEQ